MSANEILNWVAILLICFVVFGLPIIGAWEFIWRYTAPDGHEHDRP